MQSGIFLLMIAMCLTPGVDAIAKQLTADHSPFMVAFFRYFSGGLVALVAAKLFCQPIHVPKEARVGQIFRTALLVASMTCLITAFSMVPMAYAVGGFLISPIVSTAISIVFFGEKPTVGGILGVCVSFIGAIIIAKPAAGIELGSILALAGGALLGLYLVLTRNSKNTGSALSTLAVQCSVGAVLIAPLAFFGGLPELTPTFIASVLGLGFFSAGAHFLTVAAFERTEASILAPFLYFNLIAAVAVGYIFFNEIPSGISILGLLAICFGGIAAMTPQLAGELRKGK